MKSRVDSILRIETAGLFAGPDSGTESDSVPCCHPVPKQAASTGAFAAEADAPQPAFRREAPPAQEQLRRSPLAGGPLCRRYPHIGIP